MAITHEDIVALASAFHDVSMVKKSTAAEMAEFFLYPESRIFVLHGGDLTLQANYEIHQKLVDEVHWTVGTWDITPLSDTPSGRGRRESSTGRAATSTRPTARCSNAMSARIGWSNGCRRAS